MAFRRPSQKELESLCNGVGPEDGHDPRYDRKLPPGREIGRKTLQLCGEVSRILMQVLAECGDEVLRNLEVTSVSPAAGGGRLLVQLQPSISAPTTDLAEIGQRLGAARGMLRSEVAAGVHRRKAPDLVFEVLARRN